MGNWRNPPRRRIFHRQQASWSSTEPPPPEWQDGIPLWEKKFCSLVGSIPWGKIVDTKNLLDCHKSVLSWNDSAGEEAFQNAKKRFWAKINGLQCDISLPDPDIYIDDIDWNPKIDPELIKELDQDCFVPVEGERNMQVGHKNKRARNFRAVPLEGNPIDNEDNNDNPWECNIKQDIGGLKNKTQGWNQWEDYKKCSRNLNNDDNPWECDLTQCGGGMMDKRWDHSQDNTLGWNKVGNHVNQSRNWDNVDNPREHGCQGVFLVKDKGGNDARNRAWGWKQQEPKNLNNTNSTWKNRFNLNSGAFKVRGWRAIDWSPKIDPELIKELDQDRFVPTEGKRNMEVEHKNKRARNSRSVPSKGHPINDENSNDNPWERNIKQENGGLKNKTWGCNHWEDYKRCSRNLNNDDNPWERNIKQDREGMKNKTWGWNQWEDYKKCSRNSNTDDNPWECGLTQCDGGMMDHKWGHSRGNSWGRNKVGNRANQSRSWDTVDNPWEHDCQGVILVKDKGGSDPKNRAWGWNL